MESGPPETTQQAVLLLNLNNKQIENQLSDEKSMSEINSVMSSKMSGNHLNYQKYRLN